MSDRKALVRLVLWGPQRVGSARYARRLRLVRLVCLDVDGVLTDGRRSYNSNGSTSLVFDVRDGLGVYMLVRAGLEVALISNGMNEIVNRRAGELGVRHVLQGVEDKAAAVRQIAESLGVEPELRLYVGDDVWDIGAFDEVGFRVAVADALPEVRELADAITLRRGGAGAVREVADAILRAQGQAWQRLIRTAPGTQTGHDGEEIIQ